MTWQDRTKARAHDTGQDRTGTVQTVHEKQERPGVGYRHVINHDLHWICGIGASILSCSFAFGIRYCYFCHGKRWNEFYLVAYVYITVIS
jgi:hypothetical protein